MAKDDKDLFTVTLREETIIKPSGEEIIGRDEVLGLSELDRMSPVLVYTVCFYKASVSGDQLDFSVEERLERSLEKVLIPWYPAAGRLTVNGETGKLEIDCNGEGVVVKKAVADARLEDVGELHDYRGFFDVLVPMMPTHNDETSRIPLVAVQITRFACGGYSIGFAFNHALFDGFGAFHFLVSWAQISRGKDQVIEPIHSRQRFIQNLSSTLTIHNNHSPLIPFIQDLCSIPMKMKAPNHDQNSGISVSESATESNSCSGTRLLTLRVKRESIERFKMVAVERGGLMSASCSTFDVLAARIWKARVKAFNLQPTTRICLLFPVNVRNRINPPDVGKNFSGNAFVLGAAICTAVELIGEPIEKTILRIQTVKISVDDEYVSAYMKLLEFAQKVLPSMREVTIITDWMKFSFNGIDFGEGGTFAVSPVAPPVPEAVYLMNNPEEKGEVLVRMGLEDHLVQDFNHHFDDPTFCNQIIG